MFRLLLSARRKISGKKRTSGCIMWARARRAISGLIAAAASVRTRGGVVSDLV
jgi:hypothetical protein